MARKILDTVPLEQLQSDLEKYRQRALELGATHAKIIAADQIIIDERVRAKCIFPKCQSYGTNANCPPYTMDLDEARKMVNNFSYAIFYKIEVPTELVAGPKAREGKLYGPSALKNHEIASKIEAEAFHDGYHLAVAFAGGACKTIFCPDKECSALIPGQGCRAPLRARASMEAIGMDVYRMTARAGWDIYPLGRAEPPADVPFGSRMGIVLIY